jgi:hypothetical protein
MREMRNKYMEQVKGILNADQQKKLDDMRAEMKARAERAGGPGGAPRGHGAPKEK